MKRTSAQQKKKKTKKGTQKCNMHKIKKILTTASMREHGIQTKTLIQCCVVYFANGCGELRRTTRKCNNQEFPEKTRKKTQGELWNLKNKADI